MTSAPAPWSLSGGILVVELSDFPPIARCVLGRRHGPRSPPDECSPGARTRYGRSMDRRLRPQRTLDHCSPASSSPRTRSMRIPATHAHAPSRPSSRSAPPGVLSSHSHRSSPPSATATVPSPPLSMAPSAAAFCCAPPALRPIPTPAALCAYSPCIQPATYIHPRQAPDSRLRTPTPQSSAPLQYLPRPRR